MKENAIVNTEVLLKAIENAETKEVCFVLSKSKNLRVGAGARLESSAQPSLFIEVVVGMCSNSEAPDLAKIEKSVLLLKELRARGFSMTCGDDGSITCEKEVNAQEMDEECEAVRDAIKKVSY